MQRSKRIFIRVVLLFFACCWMMGAEAETSSPGIVPPTGKYTVGYREYAWINEHECPDPYFKNKKN